MFLYIGFSVGLGFLSLAAFLILQWLHIPAGSLADWFIGIASFYWLLIIVTVPWNVYFDAQEVIAEAATSREKGIAVEEKQVNYVKKAAFWSIIVAIALHFLSAIALYSLAAFGISPVGYVSSVATLLLTALRPAIRAYQYLAFRLARIRQEIQYPREDVIELRHRFNDLEFRVKGLETQMDLENPSSLVAKQQREWQESRQELARLRAVLEQFQAKNEVEHQHLSQEAKTAIAQLTEDGQFLNHVREIIRFFKMS
jgi:hypothetical protein